MAQVAADSSCMAARASCPLAAEGLSRLGEEVSDEPAGVRMAIRGRGGGNASGGGSCGGGGAASIPCWRSCCCLSRSTARRCSAEGAAGRPPPGSRQKAPAGALSAGSQLLPNNQYKIPVRRTRPLGLAWRGALAGCPAQAAIAALVALHRDVVSNDHSGSRLRERA